MGRATSTKSKGRASSSSKSLGRSSKSSQDLTTSEGLYNIAKQAGGALAKKAEELEKGTFISKVGEGLKKGLSKTLDIISRPGYASASAVKNIIDEDPNTTFVGGLKSGITGQTKHTYSDVFEEAGWKPETTVGKVTKGAAGFALDVLLDPTTYVTFGAGTGMKVGVKVGEKTLTKTVTKAGQKVLRKTAEKTGEEFGREFVSKTLSNMAEKSPELYKTFIDKGGIKFFGETLISGGRIAGTVKKIPGMTKLDEATQPLRNSLGSLFNRNISAKYGKLPNEVIELQDRLRDLGKVKTNEALEQAIEIARQNKLTIDEVHIITNAIESNLPLAPDHLNNARKLLEEKMGSNLARSQKAGIKVGELPNYVSHIFVDNPIKNIPIKPEGARVSLGASKGRTIQKFISETGEKLIGKPEKIGLKPIITGYKNSKGKIFKNFKPGTSPVIEGYKNSKGKIFKKFNATIQEINDAFGKEFFDKNIINTVAIGSVATERAILMKEYLTGIAKYGAKEGIAPSGYIKSGTKELEGLVFHPQIAESIDNFKKAFINDEGTKGLLQAFDKVQNLWKASVTSLFPAFHGRNAISNVFLNLLDIGKSALSPAKHALSVGLLNDNRIATNLEKQILRGGKVANNAKNQLDTLLKKPILTDDFGKKWTFGELRKEIKERRIAFGDEFTGFLDIRDTIQEKLGTKLTGAKKTFRETIRPVNPLSQQNEAFKLGRKVGNAIEQQARILNFMTNLEKTGDVVTSAERTKQFLFDYTNLSDFEKNVMRRLVPFYTFTRKNLELQVKQGLKQPGKLATQAKIFTNISKVSSGASLTEEETENLPSYLQEGLGIVWNRDGDKVEMINSLGTPIESVFASIKDNAFLGSLSPVIAVPLQAAIGKHFFFDKDLKDVDDATPYKNAPQFIKDYIGFTTKKKKDGTDKYIALNPTRLFILNNIPPSSRVIQTIGQLEDENVSGKLKILRQLTGIKPYGIDLTEQEAYKEKQKKRELEDLISKAGEGYIFKKFVVPK